MRFVHAADLHLDSPIRNLSRQADAPVDRLRLATRAAFAKLIDLCIAENAAFLLIAGDLYDHDYPNMQVATFLRRQLSRLADRGIRTIIVKGNHDADNRITSGLELPATILADNAPQTVVLDGLPMPVAVHGQSFKKGPMRDNLALAYPSPVPGALNIGLLHTSLAGHAEHAEYAPCALTDLHTRSYAYWALGHIHKHGVLHRDPWIVYPGNLQGRHAKEIGPKGCYLVETDGLRVVAAEHRALDVFRWEHAAIEVSGTRDETDLYERARHEIAAAVARCDGLPGALRVTLLGETALSSGLRAEPLRLRQTVVELADEVGEGELWIEKIIDETRADAVPTDRAASAAAIDILDIVDEIASDGVRLLPWLRAMLQPLRARLPEELKGLDALAVLDDPERAREMASRLAPLLAARFTGEPR